MSTQDDTTFSLVRGGLAFQFFRLARLSGESLELLRLRIVVICLVAWLPLLLLSIIQGRAFGGAVTLPFVRDIDAHARLLITLPILIGEEVIVHRRLGSLVAKFMTRNIIREADIPRFEAASNSAVRLATSYLAEIVLLLIALSFALVFLRHLTTNDISSWYSMAVNGRPVLTAAGIWYVFVSLPIVAFLLLRWYYRFLVWVRFLWSVSRLNLRLVATHPDRAGSLGFLGGTTYYFWPLLFAQGVLLSALIASRVLHGGQSLMSFKVEAAGFAAFLVIGSLAPMGFFVLHLIRAKLDGLTIYGLLASRYVTDFEHKWNPDIVNETAEPLLGTPDIQSLADLSNSYAIVSEMRSLPFTFSDAMRPIYAIAIPLLPLVLLVFSPEQLVEQIIKVLFKG